MRNLLASGIAVFLAAGIAAMHGQAAQAPARTSERQPDLTGFWQVVNTANQNIEAHSASKDGPASLGVVEGGPLPYKPEGLAKRKTNIENRATADTEARCFLPGVPRITYMPFPFQIIQTPTQITILYEYAHATRNIYTNGTPHPRSGVESWMGDSRGRWEGNTLVVDATDFNEETWFDRSGNFHSKALHVVERYTLIDADHINYEATIEDPQVFTRPWKMSMLLYRHKEANFQLLDYECYAFEFEPYYHFKKPD